MAVAYSDAMIPDWIKYIKEVQFEQEIILQNGSEFYMPFIATSMSVVKAVFIIAEYFDLNLRAKYLSLYLFDKYMCNKFWEFYKKYEDDANNYSNAWNQVAERLSSQVLLKLMSCVQLASKVDSHYKGLGISQVIAGLKLINNSLYNDNHEYTQSTIFNSEMEVFKTLKYKIPPITPLDSIEVLLVALKLRDVPKFYDATVNILDLTFLQHQNLYSQIQLMAIGSLAKTKAEKITFMTMEVDMLFLSASVIECASLLFNFKKDKQTYIVEELSNLINIKVDDISLMAKTIFELAIPNSMVSEL